MNARVRENDINRAKLVFGKLEELLKSFEIANISLLKVNVWLGEAARADIAVNNVSTMGRQEVDSCLSYTGSTAGDGGLQKEYGGISGRQGRWVI